MINSLLLFFSCYRVNKYVNFSVFALFLLNFFITERNLLNQVFTYVNLAILLLVFFACYTSKFNKFASPVSIIFYSVAVDVFCYYFFPLFPVHISIFEYVLNGILFNIKFVILPCLIVFAFEILKKFQAKKHAVYQKISYRNCIKGI